MDRLQFKKVPKTGFEPAQPFGHYHLKVACLPISPPGHPLMEIRGDFHLWNAKLGKSLETSTAFTKKSGIDNTDEMQRFDSILRSGRNPLHGNAFTVIKSRDQKKYSPICTSISSVFGYQ